MSNNLYQLLDANAQIRGDACALVFKSHEINYAQLKIASDRLAGALRALGIGIGDRIAVMLPNVPHFVISYFALLKLGAIIVPISVYDKADEARHQMEDAEVKGIIYWEKNRSVVQNAAQSLDCCRIRIVLGYEKITGEYQLPSLMETHDPLEEMQEVEPNSTAVIVYTAGVTGRPKGAELTHHNLLTNAAACKQALQLEAADRVIGNVQLSTPLGHTLMLGAFFKAGASVILSSNLDTDTLFRLIGENLPTYFTGTPAIIRDLVNYPEHETKPFQSLKFWLCSGDALKEETMEAFEGRYNVSILEGYGLTEASPMVSFNLPGHERKAGSLGLPLRDIDMRIVDQEGTEVMPGQVGEIIVQGPNVMKGYLMRPEASKEIIQDGWLYTGDLAQIDESGFGFIVARKKNVIMKSGFSVYPREVEHYLSAHPKVKEAIVIGLPDDATGEEIHACVVLKQNENATVTEIIEYLKERMATYKCPKTVFFALSLPKGPSGRVLRDQVKHYILEKMNQR